MSLIAAADKATDVQFARHPGGVTIGEYDVTPISAMVVARVWKIFIRTIGSAASIVSIINNPCVGSTGMLPDNIVPGASLGRAIHMIHHGVLSLADIGGVINRRATLAA